MYAYCSQTLDEFEDQKCRNYRTQTRKYVPSIYQLKGFIEMDTAHRRLCKCEIAKCNEVVVKELAIKSNTVSALADWGTSPRKTSIKRMATDPVIDINHQRISSTQQQPPEVPTVENLSTTSLAAVPVKSNQ